MASSLLKRDFEKKVLCQLEKYKKATENAAKGFHKIMAANRRNVFETALHILKKRKTNSSGLNRILKRNPPRPELSIEYLATRQKYQILFDKNTLKETKQRIAS